MFWTQAGMSFVVWIAFGWWFNRYPLGLKSGQRRIQKGLLGALQMVGGMFCLGTCLVLVFITQGIQANHLTPLGWVIVTIGGVQLVALQTLALRNLSSLAMESRLTSETPVTEGTTPPSSVKESN